MTETARIRAFSLGMQQAPILRDRPTALIKPDFQQLPPRVLRYVQRPPNRPFLPIQGVVDRGNLHTLRTTPGPDQKFDDDGVTKIARFSRFGPFGPDPADPAPFVRSAPFGVAVCPILAPYAAARCAQP
ncbi:hypothetical protein FR943_16885 [Mycobacterium sp. TNTM28]|uniref:Uncharacterized protein n=1 Tax=[Mycobacterium] fortunisiensis TaxID=2600579 RepID=A0ABS6KQH2_9MYCO|nr:hypothetical protein [[Mycobacterium] fortunisiensis]MBU9765516.1 hypothetical protein [[Mycobacterium] fortunisiensis]